MSSPPHPTEEIFRRLLDESSALLASPESAGVAIPDDELHREIIVPLLPAMLGDAAIRGHWSEQTATGFPARIGRHFENGDPAPRWTPGDFEIHVTASFSAGADARALADTLLSEDSLRDITAALMNQLLDALWPSLASAPSAPPAESAAEINVVAMEIPAIREALAPAKLEFASVPTVGTETVVLPSALLPSAIEPERAGEMQAAEFQATHQPPSRTLVRALCSKLPASVVGRGIAANSAPRGASAAIVARRIFQRATSPLKSIARQARRPRYPRHAIANVNGS